MAEAVRSHRMRAQDSEYLFTDAEVANFEASIRDLDALLEQLARAYRLRLIMHSGKGGWPGRTLRGRRWLKTYYLRISLDPACVDGPGSPPPRWDVYDVWMYDFAELGRRTLSYRELASAVDGDGLASPRFHEILSRAIAESFPHRR